MFLNWNWCLPPLFQLREVEIALHSGAPKNTGPSFPPASNWRTFSQTSLRKIEPQSSLPELIRWWFQVQFSSVSRSVVSDSLQPDESQHTRPPCPSQTPGVYPNSCPSSQWYHPAISSSVVPFSSCPHSLPASGSFPMSQLFAWGDQSIAVSASTSVLPNEHPGLISFRMDWLDLLAVQGTLKSLLQHHSSKFFTNSSELSFLNSPPLTSIHD